MAKDPALLFYTNDFLAGTFTMTDEQVGKYIRLLCLQHQKYELTKKDMMNICKTYDKDIFDKFKLENGVYYNLRLRKEAERRKAYSDSRRKNRESEKTYDKHMETETEAVTKTKDNNKKSLHLFSNSEYYDIAKFKDKFYSNPNYQKYDYSYYYEAVKNWADSKGAMKKDWIATARNFALNDENPKLIKPNVFRLPEH